ncbi:DUF2946 family protein [Pseudazoarcus pumilus]|uniref:DUF2946 domain-containing protein n=1 Tax=Pseudazoarcus pumilus TaxID=2067960 RepID=A0A2I6S751_9RHOO|nr:DUF2946 family protein [Pseudazoarcus pumilus]AUN95096.1 hypothetical protein C0099_09195 [Pseudazoarcus pumilus]
MRLSSRFLRLISRFALCAVLAAALLPGLGHGVAAAAAYPDWVEVCTPDGVQLRGAADDSAPGRAGLLSAHCALCLIPASDDYAEPTNGPLVRLVEGVLRTPAPHTSAHFPLDARSPAQARAPPAIG